MVALFQSWGLHSATSFCYESSVCIYLTFDHWLLPRLIVSRPYRFFPRICNAIRPLLPPLSVFVTALCVGAPLAININSVMSPFGASVLLLVIAFHLSAFIAGYSITGLVFQNAPDVKALQRTLSYETGLTVVWCPLYGIRNSILIFDSLIIPSLAQECKAVFWPLHLQIGFSKIHLWACLLQSL